MKNKSNSQRDIKPLFFSYERNGNVVLNIFTLANKDQSMDDSFKTKIIKLQQKMDAELYVKLQETFTNQLFLAGIKSSRTSNTNVSVSQSVNSYARDYRLTNDSVRKFMDHELELLQNAKSKAYKKGILNFTNIEDRIEEVQALQKKFIKPEPKLPEKKRKRTKENSTKQEENDKKLKTSKLNDYEYISLVLLNALTEVETKKTSIEGEFKCQLKMASSFNQKNFEKIAISKKDFSDEVLTNFSAILKKDNLKKLKEMMNKAKESFLTSTNIAEVRATCEELDTNFNGELSISTIAVPLTTTLPSFEELFQGLKDSGLAK